MKKLKLYIETSGVSNLDDKRNYDRMVEMQALWELLKEEVYDVVISWVVMEEINKNKSQTKRDILLDYLDQINYEMVHKSDNILSIADDIIANNILTEKSYNDCLHIACAMTSNCDCIVSYNFDDMVNIKTIKGVQALSMKHGYININIQTAGALLKKGEKNDSR